MDGSDDADRLVGIASVLYEANDDGLGVIAVHRIADERFLYNRYKRMDPDFGGEGGLKAFLQNNDEAWRFIIHARLATHGGTGFAETHPIQTGACPECDIDFVVHNGVVREAASKREEMEKNGHLFTTDVDSEAIAHKYGTLPESVTDDDFKEPSIRGSLNYILLAEDRILIRHGRKYNLTEDLVMARSKRKGWLNESAEKSGFHLFFPDGSHESDALWNHRTRRTKGWTSNRNAKTGTAAGRAGWPASTKTSTTGTTTSAASESDADDDEWSDVAVRGSSPSDRMDEYDDAEVGFLTIDPPEEREWVMEIEYHEHEGTYYYCVIHEDTFQHECDLCWEEDATHLNANVTPYTFTEHNTTVVREDREVNEEHPLRNN